MPELRETADSRKLARRAADAATANLKQIELSLVELRSRVPANPSAPSMDAIAAFRADTADIRDRINDLITQVERAKMYQRDRSQLYSTVLGYKDGDEVVTACGGNCHCGGSYCTGCSTSRQMKLKFREKVMSKIASLDELVRFRATNPSLTQENGPG